MLVKDKLAKFEEYLIYKERFEKLELLVDAINEDIDRRYLFVAYGGEKAENFFPATIQLIQQALEQELATIKKDLETMDL